MNILYLNHYAGSPALGMEYRPYYLSREWVRLGHQVLIVAGAYSHVRSQQPTAGDELIDGIHYRWLPLPRYAGNGFGRAWNIWRYLQQVWQQAPRLAAEFRPDVVIASSTYPMDIWPARRIAQLSVQRDGGSSPSAARNGRAAQAAAATLVFELHDLWPLSPMELSGMSRWHPFIQLCARAELAAYRHADCVVSMLPKVQDHVAARGLDLRRLCIVPNGIALDEWGGEGVVPRVAGDALAAADKPAVADTRPGLRADVASAIAEQRAAGRRIVGYAGSMGLPNALGSLLDAAALLRDDALAIVMVGDGLERERLVARIAHEHLQHVLLLPAIAKAQIPAFLAELDVAYIGWQDVPIYRFGIAPNKLMDYMMAGCAVLHSVAAGNDPVAESGCGLTVAPESPVDIAAGLRQMVALSAAQRRAMGQRGRAFVLAEHTYAVLAQRFLQAVQA